MNKPINQIGAVLEKKGIKHGLPKNSARASALSNPMFAIRQPNLETHFLIAGILQVDPKELTNGLDE